MDTHNEPENDNTGQNVADSFSEGMFQMLLTQVDSIKLMEQVSQSMSKKFQGRIWLLSGVMSKCENQ